MPDVIKEITVLVSDPADQETPEVFTFVDHYIEGLREAGVGARVKVSRLNHDTLSAEAVHPAPDLIVIIGHGSAEGELLFEAIEAGFSEQGRISEAVKFKDLAGQVKQWFAKPKCVLAFACHGSRWLRDAKGVKWIAFDEPMPQLATTNLVGRLVNPSGVSLLHQFKQAMTGSLAPEHAKWVQSLESSHPDAAAYPGYGRGTMTIVQGSAESFGSDRIGLPVSGVAGEFVGREQLIHFLTMPPAAESAMPRQRVTWIFGEAGIGKSALLRQAADRLRSYWFEPQAAPPLLIGLDLSGTVFFDRACKIIVDSIAACAGACIGREDAKPEDRLDECFAEIKRRRQALVLILDDLTYLDLSLTEETRNASRLVEHLFNLAKSHRVLFHCVATNRFPRNGLYPALDLELKPLSIPQAVRLSYLLLRDGNRPEVRTGPGAILSLPEFAEEHSSSVRIIFDVAGHNTKRFRELLDMGPRYSRGLKDWANQCLTGEVDLKKLDLHLVEDEWKHADAYGAVHGVNWSGFLLTLFPLARWAGSYTEDEYREWFGDWVARAGGENQCPDPARRCLDLACAKGILARAADTYHLSPNYRIQARALSTIPGQEARVKDIEARIKKHLPTPRAVGERLALCKEMASEGHPDAIMEFLDLEREMEGLEGSSTETDEALAVSMWGRAELAWELLNDFNMGQKIVSSLEEHFGSHDSDRVVEAVGMALFNRTEHIRERGTQDDYFREVERFEEKYGGHPAAGVVELVAMALFNRTHKIWETGAHEEYFREVGRFEEKYGGHQAAGVVEIVASALLNRTNNMWKTGAREEYFQEVERLEEKYGGHPAVGVIERVAMVLFNRTNKIWETGAREEYFQEVGRFEKKYGGHSAAGVVEQVAKALFNRTSKMWKMGAREEYFHEVGRFEEKYGGHSAAGVVGLVAMALFSRTNNMWETGAREEYLKEVARILEIYGERWKESCPKVLELLLSQQAKRLEQHSPESPG